MIKSPARDAAGKVSGLGAIATDATQRKRAEAALRESEERLKRHCHINHSGSKSGRLVAQIVARPLGLPGLAPVQEDRVQLPGFADRAQPVDAGRQLLRAAETPVRGATYRAGPRAEGWVIISETWYEIQTPLLGRPVATRRRAARRVAGPDGNHLQREQPGHERKL